MADQHLRRYFRGAEKLSLRERFLNAALDVLLHDDYGKVTTRSIATAAGSSESNLYRYFSSKDVLLNAVYDEAWRLIVERLRMHSYQTLPASAQDQLIRDFEELWSWYQDEEFRDVVTFALVYSRRPEAHAPSAWEGAFKQRLDMLCEAIVREYGDHDLAPGFLSDLVQNFATTVWLMWRGGADHPALGLELSTVSNRLRAMLRPTSAREPIHG